MSIYKEIDEILEEILLKDFELYKRCSVPRLTLMKEFIENNRTKVIENVLEIQTGFHAKRLILYHAAHYNIIKIFKIVLDNKHFDVSIFKEYLDVPLKMAIKNKSIEMVQLLIENGARLDVRFCLDRYSYMHLAVLANCIKIVKLLIKFGFDMNARTIISKQTPLHQAISKEYYDIARILIIHGAELDHKSLSIAVIKENHEILKLLIEHGASLITRTGFGVNSLELALSRNEIGIFKSMLYLTG